jgi:hypothetical protein
MRDAAAGRRAHAAGVELLVYLGKAKSLDSAKPTAAPTTG